MFNKNTAKGGLSDDDKFSAYVGYGMGLFFLYGLTVHWVLLELVSMAGGPRKTISSILLFLAVSLIAFLLFKFDIEDVHEKTMSTLKKTYRWASRLESAPRGVKLVVLAACFVISISSVAGHFQWMQSSEFVAGKQLTEQRMSTAYTYWAIDKKGKAIDVHVWVEPKSDSLGLFPNLSDKTMAHLYYQDLSKIQLERIGNMVERDVQAIIKQEPVFAEVFVIKRVRDTIGIYIQSHGVMGFSSYTIWSGPLVPITIFALIVCFVARQLQQSSTEGAKKGMDVLPWCVFTALFFVLCNLHLLTGNGAHGYVMTAIGSAVDGV